jgi:hypothetical protein
LSSEQEKAKEEGQSSQEKSEAFGEQEDGRGAEGL